MLYPLPETPALLLKLEDGSSALVVADLHLGFEIELSSKGINIPSQMSKFLKELKNLIISYNPSRLIFLGDLKHNVTQISLAEWHDIPEFLSQLLAMNIDIEIIIGNHDGNLEALTPRKVTLHSSRGLLLKLLNNKSIGLIHGHAWPSPKLFESETLVMGHIHPMIELKDQMGFKLIEPVWIKIDVSTENLIEHYLKYRRIIKGGKVKSPIKKFNEIFDLNPQTSRIIVMPAFNRNLSGIPINRLRSSSLLGPVLTRNIIDPNSTEIYLLDGTFLGTLSLLKNL